jgi:hypothetical protein
MTTRHILSSDGAQSDFSSVHYAHRMRRPSRYTIATAARFNKQYFSEVVTVVSPATTSCSLRSHRSKPRSPSLNSVPICLTASLSWIASYPVSKETFDHDLTPRRFLSPSSLDCITLSDSYTTTEFSIPPNICSHR